MATNININKLEINTGQIDGLPQNPRFIKDDRFEKLKQSIADFPEMLGLRELIVYPHGDKFVIIGGNMRYRACKELKFKEIPCKILPEDYPVDKMREITIKDNIAFGNNDNDILANDWDLTELTNWGMELDFELPESAVNPDDFDNNLEQKDFQYIVEVIAKSEQDQNVIYSKLDGMGYEVRFKVK